MQTTVDAQRRTSHRGRWVAVIAVVVAVGVAILVRGLVAGADASAGATEQGPSEQGLSEQLAERVVAILEEASPDEHADHGHHFDEEDRIMCAAEPFGFEPSDATSVEQVRVVYTRHMCAVAGDAFPWPQNVRAAGSIAVKLTDPPEVVLPADGTSYADEVRAIIPEQFHEQALNGDFVDPSVTEELRERIDATRAGS